ncbi:RING-H2 finger protein ATL78 [Linum grandiflorum]
MATNQLLLQLTPARRLLLVADHQSPPSPAAPAPYNDDNTFDANVVMVLSVLLCALICSLGLNSIIRCALRCSNSDHGRLSSAARLANTGIKKKALKTFPVVSFSEELNLPGLDAECVICLSDFAAGEKVKILPKCNHGFHVKCIDKWLGSHSSCPTCRHCLIETCQKIVDFNGARAVTTAPAPAVEVVINSSSSDSSEVSSSSSDTPAVEVVSSSSNGSGDNSSATPAVAAAVEAVVVISIPPLEPEGPVRDYRGTC